MDEERKNKEKEENKFDPRERGIADPSNVREAIVTRRRMSEEEEASQFAKTLGLPYLDLNIFPIDQEHITIISEENALKHKIVPIHKRGRSLKVATTDPKNKEMKKFLKEVEEAKDVKIDLFVVSKSSIERGWDEYKKIKLVDVFDYLRTGLTGEDLRNFEQELQDLIDLENKIKDIPTTQALNMILAGGVKMEASDIHLEPQKNEKVRLRYRIDGMLQTVAEFTIKIYPTIVSRVKVLSKMMINVHDTAQDGRFSIKFEEGNDLDLRVSVLPGNFGENIVIRLLNQDITDLTVDKLGLTGVNNDWMIQESEKKQGMIVNSGPTGSGKTTTLYAIINRINSADKKIISIEDPVEYQIKGVSQTQINARKGYTFESGLRSIVRQDPDVILLGEIRDSETASVAVHATLTGHLVLTTVHANSSAGVIGRLVDLGIKPALIAPAVNAFIAQRLLRRLCPHCKEKYEPAEETVDVIKKMLSLISPKAKVEIPKRIEYLWRSTGCPKCNGLGYKGRIGVFEILVMNEEIEKMIEELATESEIRHAALENGMITLEQDGVVKSLEGVTSLMEVQRVVGKGEYLMDLYEKIVVQLLSRGVAVDKEIIDRIIENNHDFDVLRDEIEKLPPREVIKYVLASGLIMRAGDIHVEPGENNFKIRYRIDGVLHDIVGLPMTDFLPFLNEIKNTMGAKTESREGVIDGRFRILVPEETKEIADKSVDVRVSIILGGFGDIVVMRLLNQSAQATELESIRLHPLNLKKLKKNVNKPNGIILNTGPTGSGKTTTLYSALEYINKPELKIITVEDPIEYQVDGVIQTQVNEKEKYTFATAMRSLLRQNPDIMMIGEIRDEETAKIAYQAGLTGHLVLSTLHTNDAAGSVQRLLNMGLQISDLATGTNCFMAQRLVRELCPNCKKEKQLDEEERGEIQAVLDSISSKTGIAVPALGKVYEPVGCEKCHNLGYFGRSPVSEILEIDEEMEKFLVSRPTTTEIRNKAIENGMLTMAQDGVLQIVEEKTTLEEVGRVTREID